MERRWMIALPILAVLLLLCIAMAVIGVISFRRLSNADALQFFGLSSYDVSAEREDEQSFNTGAPLQLVVDNACGAVSVRAVDGETVTARLHVKAWGSDEADANRALERVAMDASQEGGVLTLGLQNPDEVCGSRNPRPINVTFEIEAPAQTAVQITTRTGGIAVQGLTDDAELRSSFGDVGVQDLTGALNAESANGAVTVRGVNAGDGNIHLDSQFGLVTVEDAQAKELSITGRNGGVAIRQANIAGAALVSSDFGAITWAGGQARSLEVESKNGGLTLEDLEVAEGVQARSDFGAITMNAVRAQSYNAITMNGPIDIDGAVGNVTARSDFGSVSVRSDQDLVVDLSSDNGGVTYTGGLAAGESKLASKFGPVRLTLPEEAAFAFDLQTKFGKISSAFPIQINGAPDENHWQGAVGNGGEIKLIASTDNGNISLEMR